MAYEVVMPYHLHMPSYFLETFTEYPSEISVPLHCVFHSIRFKVNKGWSKALLLFLYL